MRNLNQNHNFNLKFIFKLKTYFKRKRRGRWRLERKMGERWPKQKGWGRREGQGGGNEKWGDVGVGWGVVDWGGLDGGREPFDSCETDVVIRFTGPIACSSCSMLVQKLPGSNGWTGPDWWPVCHQTGWSGPTFKIMAYSIDRNHKHQFGAGLVK